MESSRSSTGGRRFVKKRHFSNLEGQSSKVVAKTDNYQSLFRFAQDESNAGACSAHVAETGYRDSTKRRRLSQSSLHGSKAGGQLEAGIGSFSFESDDCGSTFSDGNIQLDSGVSQTGRVDNQFGPIRRLFSSQSKKKIPKIFSVYGRRSDISVPSHAVRSGNSSVRFHYCGEGVQGVGVKSGVSNKPVLGRLVEQESKLYSGISLDRGSAKSSDFSRFSSQYGKVPINPNPEVCVSRRGVRFSQGSGSSFRETEIKNSGFLSPFSGLDTASSKEVDVSDWSTQRNVSHCLLRESSNSSVTMADEVQMDSWSVSGKESQGCSEYPSFSQVVGSGVQLGTRSSSSSSQKSGSSIYGCVSGRVGSSLSRGGGSGCLDFSGQAVSHQFPRVEGSVAGVSAFPSSASWQGGVGSVRQFNNSLLSPEGGGDKSMGEYAVVSANSALSRIRIDYASSPTYSGSVERDCGQAVSQGSASSNRVEPTSTGVQGYLQGNVDSVSRSLCDSSECQTSSVCQSDSRSSGVPSGRVEYELGGSESVCVSSGKNHVRGTQESEGRILSDDSGGSSLAQSSLVSRLAGPLGGSASTVASHPKAFEATGGSSCLRSKGEVEKPSRLGSRFQVLRDQGFAESVAEDISAPQRLSTRRMYNLRVEQFISWAKVHELDWSCPTIATLARFFEFLFRSKNLVPGTIRGYKSALSDYFDPSIVDIKNSQALSRLVCKFFNEKPASVNRVLPWDLGVVLQALRKPPFEPLEDINLKLLTLKTVFLFALASGRRRSEIHSLDFGSIAWSDKDGVRYFSARPLLGFLPKNQKASDPISQLITIPSLKGFLNSGWDESEDRFLCPVRSLVSYLDRTADIRGVKKRLFVSFQSGKQSDICSMTISSWIRNTIKLAYADSSFQTPENIRPHSVRSAAASWAYKGGVSFPHLMESCYWHSQNSFTSFYLKDCCAQSGDKFTLGPVISAGSQV